METDYVEIIGISQFDDTIVKITNHSCVPHNTLAINNPDEIRLFINKQYVHTLPYRSYLNIKGEIGNHKKGIL